MKVLFTIAVVQSLNLAIFAWFNQVAWLRILVLRRLGVWVFISLVCPYCLNLTAPIECVAQNSIDAWQAPGLCAPPGKRFPATGFRGEDRPPQELQ